MLDGALRVRLAEREVKVPAGAAVMGPRGVPHAFWNPGPDPAHYLLVMSANIARLIAALHGRTDRTPEAARAIFRTYDAELLGDF